MTRMFRDICHDQYIVEKITYHTLFFGLLATSLNEVIRGKKDLKMVNDEPVYYIELL